MAKAVPTVRQGTNLLAADPELRLTLGPGQWVFQLYLVYDSSKNSDLSFDFTGAGVAWSTVPDLTYYVAGQSTTIVAGDKTVALVANVDGQASAGLLTFRWAQGQPHANKATTVHAGSYLLAQQVAA